MIASVTEQGSSQILMIDKNRVPVVILNEQASFIQSGSRIFLRLPHTLKWIQKNEIEDGADLLIQNELYEICTIRFSKEDSGWNQFISYQMKSEQISIGNSPQDDIYIPDERLLPSEIQIHTKSRMISDVLESGISSVNSVPIKSDSPFTAGDLFRVLDLQIMFAKDMMRINSCKRITVNLSFFHSSEETCNLENNPMTVVRRNSRNSRNSTMHDHYSEDLEEPMRLDTNNTRPLILSMGPALTMAMASAASGSFAVYNGYLNGRELIDLLPMILLPCVLLVSTLIWMPAARIYERLHLKHQKKKRIRQYSEYLNEVETRIAESRTSYQNETEQLFKTRPFNNTNVYQKASDHEDFGYIRIGTGRCEYPILLKREFKLSGNDPINPLIDAVIQRNSYLDRAPILLSLKKYQSILLELPQNDFAFLFSMIQQVTQFHGPDMMQLAVLADAQWLEQHYWIRMIPHLCIEMNGARMIASSRQQACITAKLFAENPHELNIVFVQNQSLYLVSDWKTAHTAVFLNPKHHPSGRKFIRIVSDDQYYAETSEARIQFEPAQSDDMDPYVYFRKLSGYPISQINECLTDRNPSFFDLYQVQNCKDLPIEQNWQSHLSRNGVQALIGIADDGELITLDLHERGNGPHGMIAGSTGSGKSILLITILLSLSVNYSPREVRFVIIDFKGGGVSQVFETQHGTVPHLSGVISNLEEGRSNRTMVSFANECHDREQLFQQLSAYSSSQIMSIDDYQTCWKEESGLPYLAHLLIVVDEFAELKREHPDFLNDLISLARVGRSLGIHLILATQKPSGVVNDQIWSNSRFKICLKVQEKQDSMEMLHRPDASRIQKPGRFCFLYDEIMQKGQAGYVNASLLIDSSHISLIKADGSVERSSHHTMLSTTQAVGTVREILEISNYLGYKNECLWLDELKSIRADEIKCANGLLIGQIDDYYMRNQPYLILNENRMTNYAVFSMDRTEKLRFLNTLLYSAISSTDANDEIYLLDDLNYEIEALVNCAQMIAVFSASEQESLLNMINHLMNRTPGSEGKVYIIIDDFAAMPAESEVWYDAFHALLEGSGKRNISIIVMANNCAGISCRLLSLLPERISLFNDNLQDLSQIFECNVKETVTQNSFGMIRKDHMLQFRIADTDQTMMMDLITRTVQEHGSDKHYILPSIPDHLYAEDCCEPGIPLGMGLESYEWVCIPDTETILILATYEEELYSIKDRFAGESRNLLFNPEDDEMTDEIHSADNVIVMMTLDHFQQSILSRSSRISSILYVGAGFTDQYRFTIRRRKEIKSDQGVFYQKGRNQVIKLAL